MCLKLVERLIELLEFLALAALLGHRSRRFLKHAHLALGQPKACA